MRLHPLRPFLLLVGIIGACSDAKTAVDGGADGVGGTDAAPSDVPPSNEPSGDAGVLSETHRTTLDGGICVLRTPPPYCKPTYEEELAAACQQTFKQSGACGAFLVVFGGSGYGSSACYYGANSRTLIAEFTCNDYNAYCNGQAFCFLAGGDVGGCLDRRTVGFSPLACLPGDGGASDTAGP